VKKLIIVSAAMGGAALIAFGASGTFAAFNDTGNITSAAGAGTLVLTADAPDVTAPSTALHLQPGESASFAYFVKNAGDMDGFLGASVTVTDQENGCSGSEVSADAGCVSPADTGEFSKTATIKASYINSNKKSDCTTVNPAAHALPVPEGTTLSQANVGTLVPAIVPVDHGQGGCVVLTVALPLSATNAVQGDKAQLTKTIDLEQLAQGPALRV
jgi:hypothetical protein